MNILAIDTATEACSVALIVDNTVFSHFEVCPQQHSQRLLPMIDSILKEAEVELSSLDMLAFGRGPGSFTGVRIATGMIQGLALGTGLKVAGVSTLKAMAVEVAKHAGEKVEERLIAVASDARMGEVYFSVYKQMGTTVEEVISERVCPPKQAIEQLEIAIQSTNSEMLIAGTGWSAYDDLHAWAESSRSVKANADVTLPNAKYMLDDAKAAADKNLTAHASNVEPVYLRDKVTWKKLPGRE